MKVKHKVENDTLVVTMDGAVGDGIADALQTGMPPGKFRAVVFDCKKLGSINSIGASQWFSVLKAMRKSGAVIFRDCPIPFVDYACVLPGFVQPQEIESFEVPIRCDPCESRTKTICSAEAVRALDYSLPPTKCTKCGKGVSLDVHDDDYFVFLRG